ncbi:hypothetical protein [Rugamonas aquatica]|uniref:Uncharacterized protein n=1 Tax=Rugamonas aquatica TaxID=2743357 RepID=A0A6A7N0H2_9BURK|nr:hypothetical protein [Rugamonas aquatica]MQA38461.1 hypothetical protein [Rugamonas aquatica]
MTSILLLKLLLVPCLIYLVTLAGRKWGAGVAGWLSAFPVISGPILLTITLEQGPAFAATAAEGTLLAVVAILVFSIAYAWASGRCGIAGSMLWAMAAYGLAVAGLNALHPQLPLCFGLVIGALLLSPRLFPKAALPAQASAAGTGASDVPWRMIAGALLVLTVTFAASRIGPRLSGFFAMFPIMSTVLVGFSHARSGRAFAVALLRGMVYGYYAFAVFCLTIAVTLRQGPIPQAFASAFCCALLVSLGVKRLMSIAAGKAPKLAA